jgi:hypothetical protein
MVHRMPTISKYHVHLSWTAVVLAMVSFLHAQEMNVPVDVQGPILLKILPFDRHYSDRISDALVIGIAFQPNVRSSVRAKDGLLAVFQQLQRMELDSIPIQPVIIDLDNPNWRSRILAGRIRVLYIAPIRSVDISQIIVFCRTHQILSLTGVPEYMDMGISVGISLKGDNPEIVINRNAATLEGSDFTAQLLKLARVVE